MLTHMLTHVFIHYHTGSHTCSHMFTHTHIAHTCSYTRALTCLLTHAHACTPCPQAPAHKQPPTPLYTPDTCSLASPCTPRVRGGIAHARTPGLTHPYPCPLQTLFRQEPWPAVLRATLHWRTQGWATNFSTWLSSHQAATPLQDGGSRLTGLVLARKGLKDGHSLWTGQRVAWKP